MNKKDRKALSALFDRVEAVNKKLDATDTSPGPLEAVRELVGSMAEELDDIKDQVEAMKDSEQEKFDNLSEGLQVGERGQALEGGIGELETAVSNLDDVIGSLRELENAIDSITSGFADALSSLDNAMGS